MHLCMHSKLCEIFMVYRVETVFCSVLYTIVVLRCFLTDVAQFSQVHKGWLL